MKKNGLLYLMVAGIVHSAGIEKTIPARLVSGDDYDEVMAINTKCG